MPTYLQDEVILSFTRNLELTGHYSMHNSAIMIPNARAVGKGLAKKEGDHKKLRNE